MSTDPTADPTADMSARDLALAARRRGAYGGRDSVTSSDDPADDPTAADDLAAVADALDSPRTLALAARRRARDEGRC